MGNEARKASYPPDVAAIRRRYGLPVTGKEHLEYRRAMGLERVNPRATGGVLPEPRTHYRRR